MHDYAPLLEQASAAYEQQDFAQAEAMVDAILARFPQGWDAWRLKGLLAQRSRRYPLAIQAHGKCVAARPQWYEAWNDLGICLAQSGQIEEAANAFERGVKLCPHHVGAAANLARALVMLHRPEAEAALLNAIRLDPTDAELHFQLGRLLREQGRWPEAVVSLQHAHQFAPRHVEAMKQLAGVHFDLGQTDSASQLLLAAEQLAPRDAEIQNDLGNLQRRADKYAAAVERYRRALELSPQLHSAHANLGNLLSEWGDTAEAWSHYDAAFRLRPLTRLRLLRDLLLPMIYESTEHIERSRSSFTKSLDSLLNDGVRVQVDHELMPTHFYLAYQGFNDRDLHAKIGRLAHSASRERPRGSGQNSGKIRVGFASRHLRNHTIGNLNQAILAGLSREKFEVVLLSVGHFDDGLARQMQAQADRYVVLPSEAEPAAKLVREEHLDVLYYPDLGMDTVTFTLCFQRLAPVQCCSWGHPLTTGSREMDYFISAATAEPSEAATHYTEELVLFPRLNVVYERPAEPESARDRSRWGFSADAHLYVCPQTLFKFHPEFDAILAGILRRDARGLLVLLEGNHPTWREKLLARWEKSYPGVSDRCRFLPKQSREDFLRLSATADVLLDTIHFCGGNTSYEAFAMGTPVVTWPSPYLRGRLTHAMYRQMGFEDLVVSSAEQYIDIAVRLANDAPFRERMCEQIRVNAPRLFNDREVLQWYEAFFQQAHEKARRTTMD